MKALRRRILLALLAGVLVASLTLFTAEPRAQGSSVNGEFTEIDRYIEKQADDSNIPGVAVTVVKDDRIIHSRGFGRADQTGREVTPETPFGIGSTSKSFTALSIMQLVEAGEVDLDAQVRRYVPVFSVTDPQASERITVRHLLNHTSGIPTTAGGGAIRGTSHATLEEAVEELQLVELAHPPGETFEYSNANYVVLGLLVEKVSGQSYGEYVRRKIFEPLRMDHSYVASEAAERDGMAIGHRYWFGIAASYDMPARPALVPAGYIISSAEDMSHYLSMYLNGGTYKGENVLSSESIAEMHRPAVEATLGPWAGNHPSHYGMGWYVGGPWEEDAILHRGAPPNFTAMMVLVPERELGVVTLTSAHNELPFGGAQTSTDDIPNGVVSLLLGQEPPAGRSLIKFYLIFDSVVLLIVTLQLLSLFRLLRHRTRVEIGPPSSRSVLHPALKLLPILLELGLGIFLLLTPVLASLGWRTGMLWMPDLALVLAVVGGLFVVTGLLRAVKLVKPGSAPDNALAVSQKEPGA